MVSIVLFLFLGTFARRLCLTAIPLSLLTAILVMSYFGITVNTMTLGGLAIAIGALVDDAIIDVEMSSGVLNRTRTQRRLNR